MDKYRLTEEAKQFIRELFDFWAKRGVTNLKIPQIGGRELDLLHLYKAVCKRGGYQKVCNNKLWKEIVLEFGLPKTCTSASFTLRNHYQKYLLAYENKFYFGKEGDVNLDEIPGARPRKLIKPMDEDFKYVGQEPIKHPSLENVLNTMYNNVPDTTEIMYIRKYKTSPIISEMNRILLAFESKLPEEIIFALNSLLLYSCHSSFHLEHHPSLLDSIVSYLEDIIKDIPYFKDVYFKDAKDKKLDVINNKNYPIADIMKSNEKKPSLIMSEFAKQGITEFYKPSSEVALLENTRMIFRIIRNFSFSRSNQVALCKSEKLFKLVLVLFVEGVDTEITKDCLDIISNISQHIQLKQLPECTKFCERIYKYLDSEAVEEVESALECLKNLILTQENEAIIESHLSTFLDSVINLMVHPKSDIRDSVLEFFVFLSDLKMATRVTISKHPKSLLRLVGLLVSGSGKNMDKTTKLAALILSNLSMAPASKVHFLPYERDLFVVAASDSSVSKIITSILADMENLNWNPSA